MGRRAATTTNRQRLSSELRKKKLASAMATWENEQKKPLETRLAVLTIAKMHDVPPSTLDHRIKGRRSAEDRAREQMHLHEAEEVVLVEHIKLLARRGFPMTPRMIREKATGILASRTGTEFVLGKNWVTRFLERHPELKVYRSTPLDKARANGLTPAAVARFEDAVEEVYKEHNPTEEYVYGVDETGLMLGVGASQLVVGERGQRNVYAQRSGTRELVTSVVTICADGTRLKEIIIFKGKNTLRKWGDDNPGNLRQVGEAMAGGRKSDNPILDSLPPKKAIQIKSLESSISRTSMSRQNIGQTRHGSCSLMGTIHIARLASSTLRRNTISSLFPIHHTARMPCKASMSLVLALLRSIGPRSEQHGSESMESWKRNTSSEFILPPPIGHSNRKPSAQHSGLQVYSPSNEE